MDNNQCENIPQINKCVSIVKFTPKDYRNEQMKFIDNIFKRGLPLILR